MRLLIRRPRSCTAHPVAGALSLPAVGLQWKKTARALGLPRLPDVWPFRIPPSYTCHWPPNCGVTNPSSLEHSSPTRVSGNIESGFHCSDGMTYVDSAVLDLTE